MLKTKEVTIIDDGNEITFLLTQMPARKLQTWLIQLFSVVEKDKNIKMEDIFKGKINVFELLSGIDHEKVEALIDKLYTCAKRKEGSALIQVTPENIDGMLSNLTSLFELEREVLQLNFSFFQQGDLLKTSEETQAQNKKETYNMRTTKM